MTLLDLSTHGFVRFHHVATWGGALLFCTHPAPLSFPATAYRPGQQLGSDSSNLHTLLQPHTPDGSARERGKTARGTQPVTHTDGCSCHTRC